MIVEGSDLFYEKNWFNPGVGKCIADKDLDNIRSKYFGLSRYDNEQHDAELARYKSRAVKSTMLGFNLGQMFIGKYNMSVLLSSRTLFKSFIIGDTLTFPVVDIISTTSSNLNCALIPQGIRKVVFPEGVKAIDCPFRFEDQTTHAEIVYPKSLVYLDRGFSIVDNKMPIKSNIPINAHVLNFSDNDYIPFGYTEDWLRRDGHVFKAPFSFEKLTCEETDISIQPLACAVGDYEILDLSKTNIQAIHRRAFSRCECLKEIKLPNTLEYIGYQAFDWCSSLESVDIPSSVKILDSESFAACDNLDIGKPGFFKEGLIAIGSDVFSVGEAVDTIVLPDSLKYISSSAFYVASDRKIEISIPKDCVILQDEYSNAFSKHLIEDGGMWTPDYKLEVDTFRINSEYPEIKPIRRNK